MNHLSLIAIAQLCITALAAEAGPVTIQVVDGAHRPVPGAQVDYTFGDRTGTLTSGDDGEVTLKGNLESRISLQISKHGYYSTGGELFRGGLQAGERGELVPLVADNHYEVLLKKIRQPVPMQFHQYRDFVPVSGNPLGFDLIRGDWMHPVGRGTTADLYFHFHDMVNEKESFTGTLTISFPNKGDGIQGFKAPRSFSQQFGSNLTPPHIAPADGYEPDISWTHSHKSGESYSNPFDPRQNYLIRTRTQQDESGRILKACYGWIRGPVSFDTRDPRGPQLVFEAWLNPSPDPENRSLEPVGHPDSRPRHADSAE